MAEDGQQIMWQMALQQHQQERPVLVTAGDLTEIRETLDDLLVLARHTKAPHRGALITAFALLVGLLLPVLILVIINTGQLDEINKSMIIPFDRRTNCESSAWIYEHKCHAKESLRSECATALKAVDQLAAMEPESATNITQLFEALPNDAASPAAYFITSDKAACAGWSHYTGSLMYAYCKPIARLPGSVACATLVL
jgi:hypothetical protein